MTRLHPEHYCIAAIVLLSALNAAEALGWIDLNIWHWI